ncbi:PKD domain-containing protein [Vibrio sp. WXL103]|uniref:PKD domain-containing protein n=1 Tax=Vibrio sp. WXL103 TaxID=3450710 RepID=UPI003EC7C914
MNKWLTITTMILASSAQAEIAATHIYHNHMPNFWPYYDVSEYDQLSVGSPIRYTYDGQVINLKNNPPPNYSFYIPGSGLPMPHDDLVAYYSHHAKRGAYLSWPMDTAKQNRGSHPLSQTHVTMSASVINNVQSFAELNNLDGYNLGWGNYWRETQDNTKTASGFNALDTIHFSGHHTMGPLVGNDYFLKDLIYHNVTLAQDYFLGDSFRSSKGFFPTELGFSTRIIPVLDKLGIEWSVLGNVHYSRTLRDYPYLNDPGVDTMISPPNRADLRNSSDIGNWVSIPMFNEQQVTQNKFPFASIPHWVQYVNPNTAQVQKIAGIPVEQASSWEEGYQGSVTAGVLKEFEDEAAALGRKQYFVIAHDGDNSQGRAGDGGTWAASGNVTYADSGVVGMGVEEYLRAHPIPADDIVHVQDGSWIDTRDSSADPTWYHWHLPMGVWSGQMSDFNNAHGTDYIAQRQHMVSLELGYHYLERNFALLQAAENYAKTAEQIWLDDNPNHWQPTSDRDRQVTYDGNQLNPWMMSFPVKGDENNNYAGGANPAELGWYFLIASIDSGFGYYDENVDDGVKPTISFNQSLHFTTPYVDSNLSKDRTGPSIWWPQRYPYNPGSANKSKAEGWAEVYADTTFAIYTYAFDASGIDNITVKVRPHTNKWADAKDKTYQLYDPKAHSSDPDVDPDRVGEWQSFAMKERDLSADINGVSWQPSSTQTFEVVPAELIGNMYFTYFNQFQDQLLDYYIEATDSKGNVTRSEIQQVYVGTGRFSQQGGKTVEDINGNIEGEHMFFTADVIPGNKRPVAVIEPGSQTVELGSVITLSAASSTDEDGEIVSYHWSTGETGDSITVTINELSSYSVTVTDDKGATDTTSVTFRILGQAVTSTVYYQNTQGWAEVCLHYSVDGAQTWTTAPGVKMQALQNGWYSLTVDLLEHALEFVTNDCSGRWDNNGGNNYSVGEGSWVIDSGALTEGQPDGVDNQSPVAVITPDSHTVASGTQVTLSAADSYDPDGNIVSYAWSTGETSDSITLTITSQTVVSVVVTDNEGASAEAQVTISVDNQDLAQNFDQLYFRGTANGWDATAMTLVEDNTWQLEIHFDGQAEQRFKFDLHGDWSHNYGDNNGDGVLELTGDDIYTAVAGDYIVEVNDQTLAYRLTEAGANQAPKAVIDASASQVDVGATVTFSAAGSTDSDGVISSYLWSNGATGVETSITFNSAGSHVVELKVTDDGGKTATASVTIIVNDPNQPPAANFSQLYFRGTPNNWGSSALVLVADHLWQLEVDFDGQADQRFKFDVYGDWSQNYGDNNGDGYLEQTGNDIYTSVSGRYVVELNDNDMSYQVVRVD